MGIFPGTPGGIPLHYAAELRRGRGGRMRGTVADMPGRLTRLLGWQAPSWKNMAESVPAGGTSASTRIPGSLVKRRIPRRSCARSTMSREPSLSHAGRHSKQTACLDEEYFFSGEVADFCTRVHARGMGCAVYSGCVATHESDTGSAVRDTLYNYYTLRNRFLFVKRNFRSIPGGSSFYAGLPAE